MAFAHLFSNTKGGVSCLPSPLLPPFRGGAGRMPVAFGAAVPARPPAGRCPRCGGTNGASRISPREGSIAPSPTPAPWPSACYLKLRWGWTRSSWGVPCGRSGGKGAVSPGIHALAPGAGPQRPVSDSVDTKRIHCKVYRRRAAGVSQSPELRSVRPHFGRQ